MTHRRDLLKAAMASPPALPLLYRSGSLPPRHPGWRDADLFKLYEQWVGAEYEMHRLHTILKSAETDAKKHGVHRNECEVVAAIDDKLCDVYEDFDGAVEAMMFAPATSLSGVAVKMAMWRRREARDDQIMFAFPSMGLPFSVYRDLIGMSGRRDLEHPQDEAVMRAMRRIDAERQG